MRISDWSSDVCSAVLILLNPGIEHIAFCVGAAVLDLLKGFNRHFNLARNSLMGQPLPEFGHGIDGVIQVMRSDQHIGVEQIDHALGRSEEHTSELQSLMRISYAVFCLKKKITQIINRNNKIQLNRH